MRIFIKINTQSMVKADYQGSEGKEKITIPSYLIRDIIDGVPYYYKGYKDVLNKTKTREDIMPCSTLQAEIIMYLNFLLTQALGLKKYRIFTGESGNHLAKNINYGLDLAVYDRTILTSEKINKHYANVPPELVVEVDIRVELEDLNEIEFINKKTQSLLDYGTKKVIWVVSESQKVLIAESDAEKDWLLRDWHKDFDLFQGVNANIGQYFKEQDIQL
ncbi:MAG: Uma2 family endonuclease [Bacteroidota bacterium]